MGILPAPDRSGAERIFDMSNSEEKKILDVTCAARSIWFDKHHPSVIYCDKRSGTFEKNFGKNHGGIKTLHIEPDVQCDFTSLPFDNEQFSLVVFDPPHMSRLTETSWIRAAYGNLEGDWHKMIRDGFHECMRVLKNDGVLIFKWSSIEFSTSEVIDAIGIRPLFGHHSGKKSNTHWLCFMKGVSNEDQ